MQLACTLAIRVCWIMKSMNNVIVGGYIVRRGVNPLTSVLEYSIKELGNGVQVDEAEPEMISYPHQKDCLGLLLTVMWPTCILVFYGATLNL